MGGQPFPEIPCTICAKPVDFVCAFGRHVRLFPAVRFWPRPCRGQPAWSMCVIAIYWQLTVLS
jgi:hypothetical protein